MMVQRVCEGCGDVFEALRSNGKTCSGACRQRLYRRSRVGPAPVAEPVAARVRLSKSRDSAPAAPVVVLAAAPVITTLPPAVVEPGALEAQTLIELSAVGRAETALGVAALMTARRLDTATRESAGGVASLLAAYRSTFAEATADAERAGDVLDELRSFAALKVVNGG